MTEHIKVQAFFLKDSRRTTGLVFYTGDSNVSLKTGSPSWESDAAAEWLLNCMHAGSLRFGDNREHIYSTSFSRYGGRKELHLHRNRDNIYIEEHR